jgi:hypothetical protein
VSDDPQDRALAAAFRARARSADRADCPAPERLWAALGGELSLDERRDVIDHTAACASCAEDWRLAMELRPEPVPADRHPPSRRAWARLAVAASLLLATGAGVVLWRTGEPEPPRYRGADQAAIRSLVPEAEPLPRDRCRLAWSFDPAGARYDLQVTTESLQVVAQAEGLAEPSFRVPAGALASLPAGTRLLWRVEAALPDGSRVGSPTFVAELR